MPDGIPMCWKSYNNNMARVLTDMWLTKRIRQDTSIRGTAHSPNVLQHLSMFMHIDAGVAKL